MRRPFSRLSNLTATLLVPIWGQVQDYRRGNMAWLSWKAVQKTPPPRILHLCSIAAKNPSCLIRAITLHLFIPLKSSPRILMVDLATVASLTLQPITWWVWAPALATTQETYSHPPTSPVEVPLNKPCTKGGKYWCALWITAAAPGPPLLVPSLRTHHQTPSPPWTLRSSPHTAHFLQVSHCSIFPWGDWWKRHRLPGTLTSTGCTASPQTSITGPSNKAEQYLFSYDIKTGITYFMYAFSSFPFWLKCVVRLCVQ